MQKISQKINKEILQFPYKSPKSFICQNCYHTNITSNCKKIEVKTINNKKIIRNACLNCNSPMNILICIGDSHTQFCFRDIPNIEIYRIHGITVRRLGHAEENIIKDLLSEINFIDNDTFIFSCGEVDIRRYAHTILEHMKNITYEELFSKWIENFLNNITKLKIGNAKIACLSIVPPIYSKNAPEKINEPLEKSCFAIGTDEERLKYVIKYNSLLSKKCREKNLLYINIYSKYKDEFGMLKNENTHTTIHVIDSNPTYDILKEMKLLL